MAAPSGPLTPRWSGRAARATRTVAAGGRVRDDVAGLAGHFPGLPVVPAVVQIQWAMDAAERLAGRAPILRRLEALKFKAIIQPGQLVEVAVELSAVGDAVHFRIAAGERVFSSGRCVLRQPVQPTP